MTCYIILAEWLHKQNTEISNKFKVDFFDLPSKSQEVFLELAKRLIKEFDLTKNPR